MDKWKSENGVLTVVSSVGLSDICFVDMLGHEPGATARWLEDDIGPEFNSRNVHTEVVPVANERALRRLVKSLMRDAQKLGRRPWLHFEAHGDATGIAFGDGTRLDWSKFFDRMRPLNIVTHNSLCITLASCFSFSQIGSFSFEHRAPFFMAFGWNRVVGDGEIREFIPAFYRECILRGRLDCKRPSGMRCYSAEEELIKVVGSVLMQNHTGRGRRALREKMVTDGVGRGLSPNLARRFARAFEDDVIDAVLAPMWETFLMADQPANDGRFAVHLDMLLDLARQARQQTRS